MRVKCPQRFIYIDNLEDLNFITKYLKEIVEYSLIETNQQERFITFIVKREFCSTLFSEIVNQSVFKSFKTSNNIIILNDDPKDLINFIKCHHLNITDKLKKLLIQ